MRNGWAIVAAIMALLLAAIFRPELRAVFGSSAPAETVATTAEPPAETPPPVETAPTPTASAKTIAPPPPPAPPPAAPRPTEIDGKDLKTWQAMLRGAAMRNDAGIAADAFVALAKLDPQVFADRKTRHDAVTAAHLAASATQEISDRVFEVLASPTLGHFACDILYRITSIHGGSRAAKRAAALLKSHEVLDRGTPAMQIALMVRDTPCKTRPALFEQAAQQGDERTLYLLQAMRGEHCGQISCCMKADTKLDQTIGAIRTRLSESR